jgi:alkylhydroperoxidase/carboxymuconolactone decarboxylase family protein YurZ
MSKSARVEEAIGSNVMRGVSPGLEQYCERRVLGDLWQRPGLRPRDRSIVTIGALIARNQTTELPFHIDLALENGVTAGELAELITHLAFYSGERGRRGDRAARVLRRLAERDVGGPRRQGRLRRTRAVSIRKDGAQEWSFRNQVALVTGADSGNDLATVRAFADAGAAVVLAARGDRTHDWSC